MKNTLSMLQFLAGHPWVIIIILLWTLPWKGVALWKAAQNSHKKWFIFFLIFNTMAIVEIIYIFVFSKPAAEEPIEEIPSNFQRRPKIIN